jgi:3-methyladenine DNA glycosylase AlkD
MNSEINSIIRKRIFDRAEEEYKKFQSSLIPGEDRILGVRMPCLRELAKEIAKGDWQSYLDNAWSDYYEEVMLQGLVIGYLKASPETVLKYVTRFIPKITNWGVCDSFCAGLAVAKKHREMFWNFIQPYLKSSGEF